VGRQEGRAGLVLALLNARFGESQAVRAVADRLSTWPDAEAAEAITGAADFSSLAARVEGTE
jgi:hypothetical protein